MLFMDGDGEIRTALLADAAEDTLGDLFCIRLALGVEHEHSLGAALDANAAALAASRLDL
jgi:hypothetical protein